MDRSVNSVAIHRGPVSFVYHISFLYRMKLSFSSLWLVIDRLAGEGTVFFPTVSQGGSFLNIGVWHCVEGNR